MRHVTLLLLVGWIATGCCVAPVPGAPDACRLSDELRPGGWGECCTDESSCGPGALCSPSTVGNRVCCLGRSGDRCTASPECCHFYEGIPSGCVDGRCCYDDAAGVRHCD